MLPQVKWRVMHLYYSIWLGENVCTWRSCHASLPTLPLDIAHGKSNDITKQNNANEQQLDFKRTFIIRIHCCKWSEKYSISSSFEHIHLYIHVLYTLGWVGHKQNRTNLLSVLKSKTKQFYHCCWQNTQTTNSKHCLKYAVICFTMAIG